jgi:hypothetical protein
VPNASSAPSATARAYPASPVAACYHASRDILPHNPAYRVASLAPGAFYAVDPSAYPGPLRPAVSPSAASRDILAETCQAAEPLGVQVSAWAVLLHLDDLDDRAPAPTPAPNSTSTPTASTASPP